MQIQPGQILGNLLLELVRIKLVSDEVGSVSAKMCAPDTARDKASGHTKEWPISPVGCEAADEWPVGGGPVVAFRE